MSANAAEKIIHSFDGGEQEDRKGPFYCFNFGAPIYNLVDHKVGIEKIEPFTLEVIKDSQEFVDPGRAEGKGRVRVSKFRGEVVDKEAVIPILAIHNRNWLNEAYGLNGLYFIAAFEGLAEDVVQKDLFQDLICPDRFTIEEILDDELLAEVEEFGALSVYRERLKTAQSTIR
jgi:hypothetical protein